jgi:hypothetical protein
MQRNIVPLIGLLLATGAQAQEATRLDLSLATPEVRAAPAAAASVMQRFIIERGVPGAGKLTLDDLRGGAAKSNAVLREMGPDIQWVHSYIAGDKVYCVYNATSEALIREHAQRSGFPADRVTPVAHVVDPTTAHRSR